MRPGEIDVLNVGAGHLKIAYSKADAIERERARRMVTDMLRRGYSLFVEVDGGELALVREFDAEREVYIVSDVPARSDEAEPRPQLPALRGLDDGPALTTLEDAPETKLCTKCLRPKHRGAVPEGNPDADREGDRSREIGGRMSRRKKKSPRRHRPVPIPGRAVAPTPRMEPAPMPSWEAVRWGINQLALERGEFSGYPMPLDDLTLRVSPQVYYRHGERLDGARTGPREPRVCSNADVDETVQPVIVNEWWSPQHQGYVVVYHEGGKAKHAIRHTTGRGTLLLGTLGAVAAWDIDAEYRAMSKLRELITDQAWKCYFTTGTFLESSKRSGVTYLFRRLRPTLAIGMRGAAPTILAGLCLHPLAYYEGSWAGAMVPSDDVVSHLMLMRADEHRYWRMANQHPAWTVSSGL